MSEPDKPPARVGVRELRQNLSVYLDRVKAGETLEVTEHGQPVAQLGPRPVKPLSILDRMIAEGRATRGDRGPSNDPATAARSGAWWADPDGDPAPDAQRGGSMSLAYVDLSALVKLILDEPDAGPMRRWYIEADRVACSIVGTVETRRAVVRKVDEPDHVEHILRSISTIDLDEAVARSAGSLRPLALRSLDAIHLATALELGDSLDAFVTYDDRLAEAARAVGLPVVRPA